MTIEVGEGVLVFVGVGVRVGVEVGVEVGNGVVVEGIVGVGVRVGGFGLSNRPQADSKGTQMKNKGRILRAMTAQKGAPQLGDIGSDYKSDR